MREPMELPETPPVRQARLIALWCGVAAAMLALLAYVLGVPF